MTTIHEIIEKTQEGREFVIPAGSLVEKNSMSRTGYYISPLNFRPDSVLKHDAIHYGYVVEADNINFK